MVIQNFYHFLTFGVYQDSEARNKINQYSTTYMSTSMKLSVETNLTELKIVFLEKNDFQPQENSKPVALKPNSLNVVMTEQIIPAEIILLESFSDTGEIAAAKKTVTRKLKKGHLFAFHSIFKQIKKNFFLAFEKHKTFSP